MRGLAGRWRKTPSNTPSTTVAPSVVGLVHFEPCHSVGVVVGVVVVGSTVVVVGSDVEVVDDVVTVCASARNAAGPSMHTYATRVMTATISTARERERASRA
jgi:hypothetical protein